MRLFAHVLFQPRAPVEIGGGTHTHAHTLASSGHYNEHRKRLCWIELFKPSNGTACSASAGKSESPYPEGLIRCACWMCCANSPRGGIWSFPCCIWITDCAARNRA